MRKLTLLIIMIVMLSLSGLAQAQGPVVVACGDLPQADCDLLTRAQTAMGELTSFNAAFSADLTVQNVPDFPGDLTLNVTGNATLAGDLSGLQQQPDAAQFAGDPAAMATFFNEAFGDVNAEINVTLALPEVLVAQAGGQIPASIPLEVRLVDGVGYLNFEPLREVLGASAEGLPEGWYGINLVEVMNTVAAQQAAMGEMMGQEQLDPATFEQFMDPAFINQFVEVERLEDVEADGVPAAQFRTTIDYAALLNNPDVRALIEEAAAAEGELTDAEIEQAVQAAVGALEGLSVEAVQTIGLEDALTREGEVRLVWDLSGLMDVMETPGMAVEGAPAPTVEVQAVVTYTDFNAAAEVTTPPGATVVTLEELGLPMGAMSRSR